MHVIFDEFIDFNYKRKEDGDGDEQHHTFDNNQNGEDKQNSCSRDPPKSWKIKSWKISKYHPQN